MNWLKRTKQPAVLSPLEGYNRWAASYRNESNPIKNLSDNLVEKFLPDLKQQSILDFGCGTGKFCSLAEEKNASEIVGIDLSPAMIEQARSSTKRTKFICGEVKDIELSENTFDIIISALVMGHIENLSPTLNILLRSLKRGGIFIITDFHPFLTLMQSRRTFRDTATGKSFEVRHHLHLFEEYFRIFNLLGVTIELFEEPTFNKTPVIFGMKGLKN